MRRPSRRSWPRRRAFLTFPYGAHVVVVVEVDPDTGVWKVNRMVALDDAGLSISALIVIAVTSVVASPFSLDARAYLSIAAMGLCFNPLGRLAHTIAPRYAPVSEVALFTPIETVTGTVWAALFLSELPRPAAVMGAVIVLAGVFYGTVASTRPTLAGTRPKDGGW